MPARSPGTHDAEVAAAISRELAATGGELRLTARELRDRFGRARLTEAAREQIDAALDEAGVVLEPSWEQASLDDKLVLRPARRRQRKQLLRVAALGWKGIVSLLGLVATLVGLYVFAEQRLSSHPPARLAGDFNVAVAPFMSPGESDAADGEILARQARATIAQHLEGRAHRTGVTFRVAPPPRVDGARDAADAERTAARLNADVVVYGTVRVRSGQTVVTPSFFISSRALGDAQELVGSDRLGAPIVVEGSVAESVAARIELRREISARTRTLADFFVGLSYFGQHRYDVARQWFERAAASSMGTAGTVREVVYLFLGNTAGRTGDLTEARRFYAKVLASDPRYARARFGMAEVRFQRSHGGCQPGRADAAGLRAAYRGYARAEAGARRPYGALLIQRARFGRARVLLCLSQARIEPRWADAEALFRRVVATYEGGRRSLRDEASESLASIGLIMLPTRGSRAPKPRLRAAAGYYERALALSHNPDRQAVFAEMLGFIRGRLGEVDAADRAYRRAAQLDPDPADQRRYERARRALPRP